MQLTADQTAAIRELVEETPWGDVENALRTLDLSFRILLELTADDFLFWEERADASEVPDEFSDEAWQRARRSERWRIALMARLLRAMALAYGVATEFGSRALGEACDHPTHAATFTRNVLALLYPPHADTANAAAGPQGNR